MHVRNIYIRMHANIASAALLEHCACSHCEATQARMWSCKWYSKQIVNSNTKYKILQVVIKTKQSDAIPSYHDGAGWIQQLATLHLPVIWCWQHLFWSCSNSATFGSNIGRRHCCWLLSLRDSPIALNLDRQRQWRQAYWAARDGITFGSALEM